MGLSSPFYKIIAQYFSSGFIGYISAPKVDNGWLFVLKWFRWGRAKSLPAYDAIGQT